MSVNDIKCQPPLDGVRLNIQYRPRKLQKTGMTTPQDNYKFTHQLEKVDQNKKYFRNFIYFHLFGEKKMVAEQII